MSEEIGAFEGPQRPNRNGFDPFTVDQLMEWFRVPGMGIAVIVDFRIHWAKGYGIADVQTGKRVDTETLFQAGSISKPVAAMALLKVVQEGRFFLDDDINAVLQSWKLPKGPLPAATRVTPRMLASHTSGLGDGFGFPGYSPADPLPTTVEILDGRSPANTGPVRMERQPLSAMKYSGGGSTILELALMDVIGRPFPQMVNNFVLEPLGMSSSAYEQPLSPERARKAARAHDTDGNPMGIKWHVYPELFAAGLWTTATDLAKFVIEVQESAHGNSNRVLSRATVQEMLNPVGVGDFAVGFRVERNGQGWYFTHTGSTWGFGSLLLAHKVRGYGLVVMTNTHKKQDFLTEIQQRIERVYDWDSLDKPVATDFTPKRGRAW